MSDGASTTSKPDKAVAGRDMFEHLFEQGMIEWHDQVDYAETLRGRRKAYATAILVAVGIATVQIKGDGLVVALLGVATSFFLIGAWILYTTKPTLRPFIRRTSRHLVPPLYFCGAWPLRGFPIEVIDQPRASRNFLPDINLMDKHKGDERWVWILRWAAQFKAVNQLEKANIRVSKRVKKGGLFVYAGYICLSIAFVAYTSMSNTEKTDDSSSETTADQ